MQLESLRLGEIMGSNKLARFLFYLLLFFLPTQLSRHFFFDFSFVSGIRSDYLTPTIYLTDIIIVFLIGTELIKEIKSHRSLDWPLGQAKVKSINKNSKIIIYVFLLFVFCYLLFNSLFIATNKWVALYKYIKIVEFVLLGYVIVKIKPHFLTVIKILSFSVVYSSIIAIMQFFSQRSLGGFLWFLGERTFYASTPGIAAYSIFGRIFLRPYATFPHPNVLGGFIAIILSLLIFVFIAYRGQINKFLYLWFLLSFTVGLIALVLSFSKAAWMVAVIGAILVLLEKNRLSVSRLFFNKKEYFLIIFYLLILISILFFLILPTDVIKQQESWYERRILIVAAIENSLLKPFFGLGLNNFITHVKPYMHYMSNPNIFQPVHNIYLLIFSETGLVGLAIFLGVCLIIFKKNADNFSIVTIILIQLFFLGCLDHYLLTLQQGQLLVVIFTALSLCRCYNKNTNNIFL